jgi:hypothetical protein
VGAEYGLTDNSRGSRAQVVDTYLEKLIADFI